MAPRTYPGGLTGGQMASWAAHNIRCLECGAPPGWGCAGPVTWSQYATVHKTRFTDACRAWEYQSRQVEMEQMRAWWSQQRIRAAAEADEEKLLNDPRIRNLLKLALRGTDQEAALALRRARERAQAAAAPEGPLVPGTPGPPRWQAGEDAGRSPRQIGAIQP